jgi:hypothetical protein
MDQQGARAMSDQNRGDLSDKEKIDRAAKHEEVRFLKRQQWAVAAAGVILLGGFLATIRSEQMHDVTLLEKILAVTLIAAGVWAGWFFLEDLQKGLANVRRDLNPDDHEAWTRGLEIVCLHKGILVASALVVVWAILFKVH